MGLMERIIKQSRKPTGRLGAFYARLMNIGHSQVTRWGLSHASINKDDKILDIGSGGGILNLKTTESLVNTIL
jgi:cyclopropane fatty-acyl-phospholipid synthase-like methyltransferase